MPKNVAIVLKHNKSLLGIVMMVIHALSMAFLYLIAKKISHEEMHPFQIAFLYKFFILLAVLPWCFQGGLKKNLKTKRIGMHVARGTFTLLGTLCFFVAIASKLPASNIAAITYLDHILVILIGIMYFKEKISSTKVISITLSFLGAFLIMKPWIDTIDSSYIFLFMAIAFWSMNSTVIKMLGSTEKTKAQLFYATLFSSLFSLPIALHEWKPVEPYHLKLLLGLAVCYLVHTICFFKAFKYAEVSTVLPFDYTRLIFTGILGYVLLGEIQDNLSLLGYLLIISGGINAIHMEAKKNKKISEAKKLELEAEYEQA